MKNLDIDTFAGLARTGLVSKVHMTPYPEITGGGWYLEVDHKDHGLTRDYRTKRGDVRVFKTADAAIVQLKECGYYGPVVVVMAP